MAEYLLKRLLLMIPTLLGILLLTFTVIQFVPGGPVEQMVSYLRGKGGEGAEASGGSQSMYRGRQAVDAERIAEIKALYGFDKPAYERFWLMVKGFAKLDLGTSFFHQKSVAALIREKLPVSITLGLWTLILSYAIAIPLGIAKAVRDGTRFDTISSLIILSGYAIPSFVLGVLLLVLFGGGSFLQWFPLRGLTSDNWAELSLSGKILDYLWHITLPVCASVASGFAVIALLTKNTFIEEIRKQYVLTARAKGLSNSNVMYRHIFRNALLPLLTGFPAAFIGAFLTGSLLIEMLFSLDGLGYLSYQAALQRDYPIVMGSLFVFTIAGLIAKIISDISYVIADPRVKFDEVQI